jgi:DnaA family protein
MQQLPLDLVNTPDPTLDNFVVGSNQEALAVLRQVLGGAPAARIIYLSGPAGSGKSHLLRAMAADAKARAANDLLSAPENRLDRINESDAMVWLVDDVDHLDPAGQQALFNLINQLRSLENRCLVASGANGPAQLPLRDDLRTRLAAGLVVPLFTLNDNEMLHALGQFARDRGLNASPAVLNWLLSRQRRDMRHLMAYLDGVDRFALGQHRQLTIPLLREFERTRRSEPPADTLDG